MPDPGRAATRLIEKPQRSTRTQGLYDLPEDRMRRLGASNRGNHLETRTENILKPVSRLRQRRKKWPGRKSRRVYEPESSAFLDDAAAARIIERTQKAVLVAT